MVERELSPSDIVGIYPWSLRRSSLASCRTKDKTADTSGGGTWI